jgi:hypothetical protein
MRACRLRPGLRTLMLRQAVDMSSPRSGQDQGPIGFLRVVLRDELLRPGHLRPGRLRSCVRPGVRDELLPEDLPSSLAGQAEGPVGLLRDELLRPRGLRPGGLWVWRCGPGRPGPGRCPGPSSGTGTSPGPGRQVVC